MCFTRWCLTTATSKSSNVFFLLLLFLRWFLAKFCCLVKSAVVGLISISACFVERELYVYDQRWIWFSSIFQIQGSFVRQHSMLMQFFLPTLKRVNENKNKHFGILLWAIRAVNTYTEWIVDNKCFCCWFQFAEYYAKWTRYLVTIFCLHLNVVQHQTFKIDFIHLHAFGGE